MKQSIKSMFSCVMALLLFIPQAGWADESKPEEITYGQTLGNVPLLESTVGGVSGMWGWTDPSIKPNAGTEEFEAIFTPNDTTNYKTISTMVQVTTVPAAPKVSNARAEVKSGTKLSQISAITYSAEGINAEPLYGRFILAEDNVVLHKSGAYRFTFHPESTNYTDIETQVQVKVSGGGVSGVSSGSSRPAVPAYTVRYETGDKGTIIAGNLTESVKDGSYPAHPPIVKVDNDIIFLGWSLDGETVVQPGTVSIHENTTFYAIYQSNVPSKQHQAYIQGFEDGTFRPEAAITRAEVAALITRIDGTLSSARDQTTFTDVSADAWYTPAVVSAYQKGLLAGEPDGTFKPDRPITRAEFAAVAARYLGLDQGFSSKYEDCANHWAAGYIRALTSLAVINGYEDGTFRPENNLTRAEAVKIINRMSGRSTRCKFDIDNSFTDLDKDYWAYDQIVEASQTHNCTTASSILGGLTD